MPILTELPIEMRPVGSLTANPRNYRRHTAAQLVILTDSLLLHGFQKPIVITPEGTILAGHGIWEAAKSMGVPEVPCHVYTGTNPDAFLAMDNRSSALAEDSEELLALLLRDLHQQGSLAAAGYTEEDIADLLETVDELQAQPDDAPDEDEEQEAPDARTRGAEVVREGDDEVPDVAEGGGRCRLGDIWRVGRHRLAVGDSTDPTLLAMLLDGVQPALVCTDPPYGISVVQNSRVGGGGHFGGIKNDPTRRDKPYSTKGKLKDIQKARDEMLQSGKTPEEHRGSYGRGLIKANDYVPVAGDDAPFDPTWLLSLAPQQIIFGANYFTPFLPPTKGWFVWDKLDGMEGTSLHYSDCELGYTSFGKPTRIFRHRWHGLVKASEHGQKRVHPTQKPVALLAVLIDYYAADFSEGAVIIDPYAGSGSTLLACERLGRISMGAELSPEYCEIILQRMEAACECEAELIYRQDGEIVTEASD